MQYFFSFRNSNRMTDNAFATGMRSIWQLLFKKELLIIIGKHFNSSFFCFVFSLYFFWTSTIFWTFVIALYLPLEIRWGHFLCGFFALKFNICGRKNCWKSEQRNALNQAWKKWEKIIIERIVPMIICIGFYWFSQCDI